MAGSTTGGSWPVDEVAVICKDKLLVQLWDVLQERPELPKNAGKPPTYENMTQWKTTPQSKRTCKERIQQIKKKQQMLRHQKNYEEETTVKTYKGRNWKVWESFKQTDCQLKRPRISWQSLNFLDNGSCQNICFSILTYLLRDAQEHGWADAILEPSPPLLGRILRNLPRSSKQRLRCFGGVLPWRRVGRLCVRCLWICADSDFVNQHDWFINSELDHFLSPARSLAGQALHFRLLQSKSPRTFHFPELLFDFLKHSWPALYFTIHRTPA